MLLEASRRDSIDLTVLIFDDTVIPSPSFNNVIFIE